MNSPGSASYSTVVSPMFAAGRPNRFSTVRLADVIYVLEKGQVVEWGSHRDLLAAQGRYAQMFAIQAARLAGEGLVDERREAGDV